MGYKTRKSHWGIYEKIHEVYRRSWQYIIAEGNRHAKARPMRWFDILGTPSPWGSSYLPVLGILITECLPVLA